MQNTLLVAPRCSAFEEVEFPPAQNPDGYGKAQMSAGQRIFNWAKLWLQPQKHIAYNLDLMFQCTQRLRTRFSDEDSFNINYFALGVRQPVPGSQDHNTVYVTYAVRNDIRNIEDNGKDYEEGNEDESLVTFIGSQTTKNNYAVGAFSYIKTRDMEPPGQGRKEKRKIGRIIVELTQESKDKVKEISGSLKQYGEYYHVFPEQQKYKELLDLPDVWAALLAFVCRPILFIGYTFVFRVIQQEKDPDDAEDNVSPQFIELVFSPMNWQNALSDPPHVSNSP